MKSYRGFIAIGIDANSKIKELIQAIKKAQADVKLVEPENIHITLKFLGDVCEDQTNNIVSIITNACIDSKPFFLDLVGTDVFPNRDYIKIIWVGLKHIESIEPIAMHINEKLGRLGFDKDKRSFSPHVTIGRVRTAKNKQKLLSTIQQFQNVEFGKQKVDSIKLMKSVLTPKGPLYAVIKEINLL
jgi:2'-5' RNA ligase